MSTYAAIELKSQIFLTGHAAALVCRALGCGARHVIAGANQRQGASVMVRV